MERERTIKQDPTNVPILDKDLEQRLLASNLVNKIKHHPNRFNITLTGEGVIELVKAFLASMKENVPATKFVPSGHTIAAVTDASLISQKELVTDFKINMNQLLTLQRHGKLTPVRVHRHVYYKKEELKNLNLPFDGKQ